MGSFGARSEALLDAARYGSRCVEAENMSQVPSTISFASCLDGQDCLQAVSMKTADRLKLAQQAWDAGSEQNVTLRGYDPEQAGQGGGICCLTCVREACRIPLRTTTTPSTRWVSEVLVERMANALWEANKAQQLYEGQMAHVLECLQDMEEKSGIPELLDVGLPFPQTFWARQRVCVPCALAGSRAGLGWQVLPVFGVLRPGCWLYSHSRSNADICRWDCRCYQ